MFRIKTLAMIALVAMVAAPVMADTKEYRVRNNSGATVSGFTYTFSGAGVLGVKLLTNADSCPATTPTNVGDAITVNWAQNCLVDNDVVIIRVTATNALPSNPVSVAGGQFTVQAGSPIAMGAGALFHLVGGVPTVSQWGLIIMTMLLLTAATVIFARRRPATVRA